MEGSEGMSHKDTEKLCVSVSPWLIVLCELALTL